MTGPGAGRRRRRRGGGMVRAGAVDRVPAHDHRRRLRTIPADRRRRSVRPAGGVRRRRAGPPHQRRLVPLPARRRPRAVPDRAVPSQPGRRRLRTVGGGHVAIGVDRRRRPPGRHAVAALRHATDRPAHRRTAPRTRRRAQAPPLVHRRHRACPSRCGRCSPATPCSVSPPRSARPARRSPVATPSTCTPPERRCSTRRPHRT